MVLCPFSTFALIDCSCQRLPARQTSPNWVQKTNDWHSGSVWCAAVLSLFDSNVWHCCGLTSLCLSCISWHIGIRWLRVSGDHYEYSKSRNPFRAKKMKKIKGPPATRPQQQQPGCCCSEACFLTGLLSMDSKHAASKDESSICSGKHALSKQINTVRGKVGVKEERLEVKEKSARSSCVSLGLQAGTRPGSDKAMAFLHILPSSGWHSSSVIGYLKGRSCFVRNDFLSPFPEVCVLPDSRCLTEAA